MKVDRQEIFERYVRDAALPQRISLSLAKGLHAENYREFCGDTKPFTFGVFRRKLQTMGIEVVVKARAKWPAVEVTLPSGGAAAGQLLGGYYRGVEKVSWYRIIEGRRRGMFVEMRVRFADGHTFAESRETTLEALPRIVRDAALQDAGCVTLEAMP